MNGINIEDCSFPVFFSRVLVLVLLDFGMTVI